MMCGFKILSQFHPFSSQWYFTGVDTTGSDSFHQLVSKTTNANLLIPSWLTGKHLNSLANIFELRHEKTNILVSDQVRH